MDRRLFGNLFDAGMIFVDLSVFFGEMGLVGVRKIMGGTVTMSAVIVSMLVVVGRHRKGRNSVRAPARLLLRVSVRGYPHSHR